MNIDYKCSSMKGSYDRTKQLIKCAIVLLPLREMDLSHDLYEASS